MTFSACPAEVVEVAGDARSLLGHREPQLALGVRLAAESALAAHAQTVADHPRTEPEHAAEERGHDRELVAADAGARDVQRETGSDDGRRHATSPRRRMEAEREERDGRPERRPVRIVEREEQAARGGRESEDAERRSPSSQQPQRRERHEQDPEPVDLGALVGWAALVPFIGPSVRRKAAAAMPPSTAHRRSRDVGRELTPASSVPATARHSLAREQDRASCPRGTAG